MVSIESIIQHARENGIEKYERFVGYTNEDKGNKMIVFLTKTLHSRKVTDWGRDEDNDMFIGLNQEGWIRYEHTIQYGMGSIEITDPSTERLDDKDVLAYLTGADCIDTEYLSFMSKAYKLCY